jgi:hypothetical protein
VLAVSAEKTRWGLTYRVFFPCGANLGNTRDLPIHEPGPGEITAVLTYEVFWAYSFRSFSSPSLIASNKGLWLYSRRPRRTEACPCALFDSLKYPVDQSLCGHLVGRTFVDELEESLVDLALRLRHACQRRGVAYGIIQSVEFLPQL